jgi:hypothetical protein
VTNVASASHTYMSDGNRHVTVTATAPGCPSETIGLDIVVTGCFAASVAPIRASAAPAPEPPGSEQLVLAFVLMLIGPTLVVLSIGVGLLGTGIAGSSLGATGAILFFFWTIRGVATTPCSLTQTIHCLLLWLVKLVAPVLVAVAWYLGGLGPGLAAGLLWVLWALLYARLGSVMRRVDCERQC